jgi:SAM-dependent methyltransferase
MTADWYDVTTEDHFWFQWRFARIRALLEGIDLGSSILEVGCGHGVVRGQLEQHLGRAVDGCDISWDVLRRARSGRGRLYLYDIHDRNPQWADYFDTVFLLDTLEHIGSPHEFLLSIRHHVKCGGWLIVNVPAVPWLYSRFDAAAGHQKRYASRMLTRELGGAGFALTRRRYWGFSLLPLLALRKLAVRQCPQDRVIARGLQPPNAWADRMLRILMHAEQRIMPRPPWGSSLMVLARKLDTL